MFVSEERFSLSCDSLMFLRYRGKILQNSWIQLLGLADFSWNTEFSYIAENGIFRWPSKTQQIFKIISSKTWHCINRNWSNVWWSVILLISYHGHWFKSLATRFVMLRMSFYIIYRSDTPTFAGNKTELTFLTHLYFFHMCKKPCKTLGNKTGGWHWTDIKRVRRDTWLTAVRSRGQD